MKGKVFTLKEWATPCSKILQYCIGGVHVEVLSCPPVAEYRFITACNGCEGKPLIHEIELPNDSVDKLKGDIGKVFVNGEDRTSEAIAILRTIGR
jgi:hypothetical protein